MSKDVGAVMPDEFVQKLDDEIEEWGHRSRASFVRYAVVSTARDLGMSELRAQNENEGE